MTFGRGEWGLSKVVEGLFEGVLWAGIYFYKQKGREDYWDSGGRLVLPGQHAADAQET